MWSMAPRYTVQDPKRALTSWLEVTGDERRRIAVLDWLDLLAGSGLSAVSAYGWERPAGRGHKLWAADVPGTRCVVVFSILDVPVRAILVIDVFDLDD